MLRRLIAVQLDEIQHELVGDCDNALHRFIDEDAHLHHVRRNRLHDATSSNQINSARTLSAEIQADGVRTGVDRRPRISGRCDTTDFDPKHGSPAFRGASWGAVCLPSSPITRFPYNRYNRQILTHVSRPPESM